MRTRKTLLFRPVFALLLTSLLLVGCSGVDAIWHGDVARPMTEDRWPIPLGGPVEDVSFKDLYVLKSGAAGSAPEGYYFIRFWPDGRCAHRYIQMTSFPTPQDGDRKESLLLGRYTSSGGAIQITVFEGHQGEFLTKRGVIAADRIELETPRKGYVDVYRKTNFPAGAMRRLQPDW